MPEYRQHADAPWDLNPYYGRHIVAMTAEHLDAKCDIAEELAIRDKQIAALRAERDRLREALLNLSNAAFALVGHEHPRMDLLKREALRNAMAEADTILDALAGKLKQSVSRPDPRPEALNKDGSPWTPTPAQDGGERG